MRIGELEIQSVLAGWFGLDGGSMFGVVPRVLWDRSQPADERNRITMALRPLLIRCPDGRAILIDAGIGPRLDAKQQSIYAYRSPHNGVVGALARLGVAPERISDVIVTHLHFDHAAGLLRPGPDGRLQPTFPRARVHLQEEAWDWARSPSEWDRASFFGGDFPIWEQELALVLLRGDAEIAAGVRVQATAGHTPGHQIAVVGDGASAGAVVYCADLIPTADHVRLPYIMAYDHQPLRTLDEKKVLLAQALEEDWILAFEHDPRLAACRLRERDGRVEAGAAVCLNVP